MRLLTVLALFAAAPAVAQDEGGYDAHGILLVPTDQDLHDPLTVWRPEAQVPGAVGINGLLEYANHPLVFKAVEGGVEEEIALVKDLVTLNLGAYAGLHKRIGLGVHMPVYLYSDGYFGSAGPAPGDLKAYAPIGLVLPEEFPDRNGTFGLSVIPGLTIPTGADGRFLGGPGFGGSLFLAGSYGMDRWTFSANFGGALRSGADYENLNGGAALQGSAAGSFSLTDHVATVLEAYIRPTLVKNEQRLTETPSEAVLSLRGRGDKGLSWTVGAAAPLTRGASAARYRLFLGIGWTFNKPLVRDRDLDGILDADDSCVDEPETFNEYIDEDGCPDALGTVRVKVLDPDGHIAAGVPISVNGEHIGFTDEQGYIEVTKQLPGEKLGVQANPSVRSLWAPGLEEVEVVEGLAEHTIRLAWVPGALRVIARDANTKRPLPALVSFVADDHAEKGVAPAENLDAEGTGLFQLPGGKWQIVVSSPGLTTVSREITIDPAQTALMVVEVELGASKVQLTRDEIILLDQILFDFDKAHIQAESMQLVKEIAATLLLNDKIEHVEVQGHTDPRGSEIYNKDLSQRRMETVVDAIVDEGVARERLTAVGYGESCPIVSDASEEGHRQNRRVQFFILDTMDPAKIPCHDGNPAARATPHAIQDGVLQPVELPEGFLTPEDAAREAGEFDE